MVDHKQAHLDFSGYLIFKTQVVSNSFPSSIFFYDKHSGEIIFEIDNSKKTKQTFFIINWGFFETLNNMFPYNSPGLGKIGVDAEKLLINWAKEKLSEFIFYDKIIFDFDEYDNSIFNMVHIQGVDLNNN